MHDLPSYLILLRSPRLLWSQCTVIFMGLVDDNDENVWNGDLLDNFSLLCTYTTVIIYCSKHESLMSLFSLTFISPNLPIQWYKWANKFSALNKILKLGLEFIIDFIKVSQIPPKSITTYIQWTDQNLLWRYNSDNCTICLRRAKTVVASPHT